MLFPPSGFGVITTTGRSTGKPRRKCIRTIRRGDKVYAVSIGVPRRAGCGETAVLSYSGSGANVGGDCRISREGGAHVPQPLPFLFQAFLQTGSAVGRLDFDSVDDLAAYAEKVVRIETAAEPVATDSALFFAPEGGPLDPTHYSRRFMAEPLMEQVETEIGFAVEGLLGDAATKAALVKALGTSKAASGVCDGRPEQPVRQGECEARECRGSHQAGNADADTGGRGADNERVPLPKRRTELSRLRRSRSTTARRAGLSFTGTIASLSPAAV